MKNKYITILDFVDGRVYQYDVSFQVNELGWQPDNDNCEVYIVNKGHSLSNCEWMVHSDPQLITT